MLMTPAPVGLLRVGFELDKSGLLAMVFLYPHTIRTIFMAVPLMIVIVLYVMVAAGVLLIFRSQRGGRQCDRNY
jgi:uncharacterized membrane protein